MSVGDDDEPVGYGRPPRNTRFRPGQSGNPKGRPPSIRRSVTITRRYRDVRTISDTGIEIRTPQGREQMTVSEAVIWRLAIKAMSGDLPSMKLWLELETKALERHGESHPVVRLTDILLGIAETTSGKTRKWHLDAFDLHAKVAKKLT